MLKRPKKKEQARPSNRQLILSSPTDQTSSHRILRYCVEGRRSGRRRVLIANSVAGPLIFKACAHADNPTYAGIGGGPSQLHGYLDHRPMKPEAPVTRTRNQSLAWKTLKMSLTLGTILGKVANRSGRGSVYTSSPNRKGRALFGELFSQ
jgi:hypothetical protein